MHQTWQYRAESIQLSDMQTTESVWYTQSAFTVSAMISGAVSVTGVFFRLTLKVNGHYQWDIYYTISRDRVYQEKSRNSSPLMPIPTRWNAGWHSAMEYCVLILQYKTLKSTSLLMHVACLLRDLPSHSINDIRYTCKFEYFREC